MIFIFPLVVNSGNKKNTQIQNKCTFSYTILLKRLCLNWVSDIKTFRSYYYITKTTEFVMKF